MENVWMLRTVHIISDVKYQVTTAFKFHLAHVLKSCNIFILNVNILQYAKKYILGNYKFMIKIFRCWLINVGEDFFQNSFRRNASYSSWEPLL